MSDSWYVDENFNVMTGYDAKRAIEGNSDAQYLSEDEGVIRVPVDRWKIAQEFEHRGWMSKWIGAEDDRNYQHMIDFDYYSMLRGMTFENAIELGCGPFTNLRLIGTVCKIEECALLDPLIMSYIKHSNCRYDKTVLRCDSNLNPKFNSFRVFRLVRRLARRAVPGPLVTNNIHIHQLISSPIEQMPTTGRYDLIVIINVIEHCYNLNLIFENILKIAAPNAILVFHDRYYDHQMIQKLLKDRLYDAGHPLRVSLKLIDSFFERNFEIIYKKIVEETHDNPVMPKNNSIYLVGRYAINGMSKVG
jgi:SAM-dependent methyltransferase